VTQSAAGDLTALPVADRLWLIEDLWDSIEAEASDPLLLPDWHRRDIERRLDSLDAGSSIGTPWDEVRERIVSRP
jgi:putative addiction module component (TIGR02574 family)